jgi:hypothetical protein
MPLAGDTSEVAGRCRDLQPDPSGLRILTSIAGLGEPWERHQVEQAGVEALRRSAEAGSVDAAFLTLRERLIQLGWHNAAEIGPAT